MRFSYLFLLSGGISLIVGRLIVSSEDKHFLGKVRLTFGCGLIAGIILLMFMRHFSWWEVGLQVLTIIIGAFIGDMLSNPSIGNLIEDYEESVEQQTIYFKGLFNNKGYKTINEPYSKRIFDLAMSLLGLIIISPFCLIIGLVIWLDDPGPILFSKHSVGKGGIVFKEYKFRTMKTGSMLGKIEDRVRDERLLKIGTFLRRNHIDELPQIFNILKAEMSLVGPRPIRTIDELAANKLVPNFGERHIVLPGIAGLAQIRSGYHTDPATRLKYDLRYIKKRSMALDLKIIFLSVVGTLAKTKSSGYHNPKK